MNQLLELSGTCPKYSVASRKARVWAERERERDVRDDVRPGSACRRAEDAGSELGLNCSGAELSDGCRIELGGVQW